MKKLSTEKEIFLTSGYLSQDFQGHITYTVLLPSDIKTLKIDFTFDKREAEQSYEEISQRCMNAMKINADHVELKEEELQFISKFPKSEINMSVFLDDQCLGTAHRNELNKNVVLSATKSSDGFMPCQPKGILRIVLHALHVLNPETPYTLSVKGVS